MPQYNLDFGDGTSAVVSGPAGATVKELLAIFDRQTAAEAEEAPVAGLSAVNQALLDAYTTEGDDEEADIIDQGQELIKGLVSGIPGVLETAALGAIAPLPEGAEATLRKGIQIVGDAATWEAQKGHEQLVGRKFGEALGSYLGIGGAFLINPLLGAGIAVGAGAGEASERARAAGATEGERGISTLLGGGVGLTELIPPARIINAFRKGLGPKVANEFWGRTKRIAKEAGFEAAQEFTAGVAQNLIEKKIYNPERGYFEGAVEEGLYGGGVGGFVQAVMEIIAPRRRAPDPSAPDATQLELFGDVPVSGEAGPVDLGTRPVEAEIANIPGYPYGPRSEADIASDAERREGEAGLRAQDAETRQAVEDDISGIRGVYGPRGEADIADEIRRREDVEAARPPQYPYGPRSEAELAEDTRRRAESDQLDIFDPQQLENRDIEETLQIEELLAQDARKEKDAAETAQLEDMLAEDTQVQAAQEDMLGEAQTAQRQAVSLAEQNRPIVQQGAQARNNVLQDVINKITNISSVPVQLWGLERTSGRYPADSSDTTGNEEAAWRDRQVADFSAALAAAGVANTQPTNAEVTSIFEAADAKIAAAKAQQPTAAVDPGDLTPPTDLSAMEERIPLAGMPPRVDTPLDRPSTDRPSTPPALLGRAGAGVIRPPSRREKTVMSQQAQGIEADIAENESRQGELFEDPATVGEATPLAEPVIDRLPGQKKSYQQKLRDRRRAEVAAEKTALEDERLSAPDPGGVSDELNPVAMLQMFLDSKIITKEILDLLGVPETGAGAAIRERIEGKALDPAPTEPVRQTVDDKQKRGKDKIEGTPRQQLAHFAGLKSTPLDAKSRIHRFLSDSPGAQMDIFQPKPRAPKPRGPQGAGPGPGPGRAKAKAKSTKEAKPDTTKAKSTKEAKPDTTKAEPEPAPAEGQVEGPETATELLDRLGVAARAMVRTRIKDKDSATVQTELEKYAKITKVEGAKEAIGAWLADTTEAEPQTPAAKIIADVGEVVRPDVKKVDKTVRGQLTQSFFTAPYPREGEEVRVSDPKTGETRLVSLDQELTKEDARKVLALLKTKIPSKQTKPTDPKALEKWVGDAYARAAQIYFSRHGHPADALTTIAYEIIFPDISAPSDVYTKKEKAFKDSPQYRNLSASEKKQALSAFREVEQRAKIYSPQEGATQQEKDFFAGTGFEPALYARAWVANNLSSKADTSLHDLLQAYQTLARKAKTENNAVAANVDPSPMQQQSRQADIEFQKTLDPSFDVEGQDSQDTVEVSTETLVTAIGNIAIADADQAVEQQDAQDVVVVMLQKSQLPLSADAVTGLDMPTHPIIGSLLKQGKFGAALRALQATAQTKRVAQIAGVLAEIVSDTKVEVRNHVTDAAGNPIAGFFDPKTNTVVLDADTGINAHTILHEMTHAAVSHTLANKSHPITKQLNKLFRDVVDSGMLDTAYGATNLDEFVSEAFGNLEFQRKLAAINYGRGELSALRRFVNTIGNYLRRKLGMKTKPADFSFDKVDKLINAMLAPAPQSRDAAAMYLLSAEETLKTITGGLGEVVKYLDPAKSSKRREGHVDNVVELYRTMTVVPAKQLLLKLLGTRNLGQVSLANGLGRLGVEVHEVLQKQRGAMQASDKKIKAVVADILPWATKYPKASAALDRVIYSMEHGATIWQVDPTKPEEHYSKYSLSYTDANKKTHWQYYDSADARTAGIEARKNSGKKARVGLDPDSVKHDKWKAQRSDWNMMGPKGHDVYNKIRNTYKEQYEELKRVINRQIDSLTEVDPNDSADTKAKKAAANAKLKNEIFSKLFDTATLDVYFPLLRVGDHKLSYEVKNPNPKEGEEDSYVMRMFTTSRERDRVAKELEADPNIVPGTVKKLQDEMKLQDFRESAPATSFVGETLRIIEGIPVDKDNKGATNDAKEELLRLFISTLPETSFAKSLQRRGNVAGFVGKSVLGLRTKAYDLGRQTERLKYSAILRDLETRIVEAQPPKADPARDKPWYSPKYAISRMEKGAMADFETNKKELLARTKFGRQGAHYKGLERYVKALNQGAFLYTIGFNPSSAVVNLSQIPLFAYPYLAMQHGWGSSSAAIRDAARSTNVSRNAIDQLYDVNSDGDYVLKKDINKYLAANKKYKTPFDGTDILTKEQIAYLEDSDVLMRIAMEQGQLGQSSMEAFMGSEEGDRVRTGHGASNLLDAISSTSAIFFDAAERYNRQVLLLATNKLHLDAMEKSKKYYVYTHGKFMNTAAMSKPKRKQLAAEEALYQTDALNGGTMLETAPGISQQHVGRVAFMYKGYGLNMYTTMIRSAKTALDGMEDKEMRKVAAKQLASVFGSSALLAGVQGVPLYGMVAMLMDLLWYDDEEENFDTVVRKGLGEGWYKGWLAQATGLDVASRIKLTDLILEENRFNQDPSMEESLYRVLGGPAGSTIKRFGRGVDNLVEGDVERALENFVPPAIANFWKNALPWGRTQREGAVTRRHDPIVSDLTGVELGGWALGFTPTRYLLEQDKNLQYMEIGNAARERRAKLLKQFYLARRVGDAELARDVSEGIHKFNNRYAGTKAFITYETLKRSYMGHLETTAYGTDSGVQMPALLRQQLRALRAEWNQ